MPEYPYIILPVLAIRHERNNLSALVAAIYPVKAVEVLPVELLLVVLLHHEIVAGHLIFTLAHFSLPIPTLSRQYRRISGMERPAIRVGAKGMAS